MNATISARILTLVGAGQTLDSAIDAVIGKGAYEKLVGEVYDALRTPEPTPSLVGKTARRFSACGPCIEQGVVISHTDKTVTVMTRSWGPDRPGKPTRMGGYDWHSNGSRPIGEGLLHTTPCPSCMEHEHTQYPRGYED